MGGSCEGHVTLCYICRVEIEAEIRVRVDELMREELKNLKLVGIKAILVFEFKF